MLQGVPEEHHHGLAAGQLRKTVKLRFGSDAEIEIRDSRGRLVYERTGQGGRQRLKGGTIILGRWPAKDES
jgi:hypothetical protein